MAFSSSRRDSREDDVLRAVQQHHPVTANDVAKLLRLTRACVDKHLAALRSGKKIHAASQERLTPCAPPTSMWEPGSGDGRPPRRQSKYAPVVRAPAMPTLTRFAGGRNPWKGRPA
jgi:predicted ArsR family transcriptional regulator